MTLHATHHGYAEHSAACPYHRRAAERPDVGQPAVERISVSEWIVRGYKEGRQLLRAETARQAGFMSELALDSGILKRQPVLFMEGEEHRAMRQDTGRFFTPATVDKSYRDMIDTLSDSLVERLKAKGSADLSALSMELAVGVASRILGLTDSRIGGLSARLSGVLNNASSLTGRGLAFVFGQLRMQASMLAFYWLDVKPSLRARRASPQNDVFSYLIGLGYSDIELLTEAIVYGVAGMATTREFICAALWHILERPELRDLMLNCDEPERYALLGEILRLEPVIGDLFRRTTADTDVETGEGVVTIPKGARVRISIVAANADEGVAGRHPHAVCPGRRLTEMRPKAPEHLLGFGDGDHRCPGAYVALRETDIFLRKLLAIPTLRLTRGPKRTFSDVVRGYELRQMIVSV